MREDDHPLLVYDLGRGWPPSASLEEGRGWLPIASPEGMAIGAQRVCVNFSPSSRDGYRELYRDVDRDLNRGWL